MSSFNNERRFFNYPEPQEGNPVLRGPFLVAAAFLMEWIRFIRETAWANAGFASLRKIRTYLEHFEPRYDPTVVPIALSEAEAKERGERVQISALQQANNSQTLNPSKFYSAADYRALYLSGELTPVDVAKAILPLVETDGPTPGRHAQGWRELNVERIMRAAEASTERYKNKQPLGPLDGVPSAIKDDYDLDGYSTTLGSPRDYTETPKDGESTTSWIVRKLEEAGVVIIGKLAMHEFGLDTTGNNPNQGTPRNPFNSGYYTGGSSSGPAYAVSSGLIPLALGSDGGGSIRIPGSFCSVFGLKPTHNRLASWPGANHSPTCAVQGPLAVDMQSLAAAYEAIAEPHPSTQFPPLALQPSPPVTKVLGIFDAWISRATPSVQSLVRGLVESLAAKHGYTLVPIEIPFPAEGQMAHALTVLTDASTLLYDTKGLTPANKILLALGRTTPSTDYLLAQKLRGMLMQHLSYLWKTYPGMLIITPTTACAGAPIRGGKSELSYGVNDGNYTLQSMEYVWLANFCGLPAITVPAGYVVPEGRKGAGEVADRDTEGKIPVGLMATGEWCSEDALLQFGFDAEAAGQDLRSKPPNWEDVIERAKDEAKMSRGPRRGVGKQKNKDDGAVSVAQYPIRELTSSEEDIQQAWQLWHTIFLDWPIEQSRFAGLLFGIKGQHWIHEHGFCLSYYSKSGNSGHIAAIGVLPEYRCKGLGNALLEKGKTGLKDEAKSAGQELKSLAIGSIFPRFWYRVPTGISPDAKEFLSHRGSYDTTDTVRDLFKDIQAEIVPPEIMERVSKINIKFTPWSPELYEECMAKQNELFTWGGIYEALAARGQHHEVMVAIDPDTNKQIGWTLMCSFGSSAGDAFAFIPLLPSGEKTGLIAAVGVDEAARGKGVGLALVVKAMENLKERGMQGILIDAVAIRGFYEKLGFETKWDIGPFTARQVYDNLPLPPGSQCIRVLDVHQSVPADGDRLTGTLRTVDLQTLPKFTALSYVWGEGSHHKIACNGCDINITQSCYEALTSLRQSCLALTIWADAICINQEDNNEKEQQIVLMGSIYTLAETVYVWLGVGNTETDQAAEYISTISQFRLFPAEVPQSSRGMTRRPLLRRLIDIGRYTLPLGFRSMWLEPLFTKKYQRGSVFWFVRAMPYARFRYADRIEQLSSLPFVCRDAINTLLDRTWLSRAWTFQEMTLASNPVLVCGRHHIPWLVMHQALTFIEHSATQKLTDPVNSVVSEVQQRVHNEVSRSDSFKNWQALFDVWQTIPRQSRPSSYRHSAMQGSICSVHDCVQALGIAKIIRRRHLILLSLGFCEVVVFLAIYIMGLVFTGIVFMFYSFFILFVVLPITCFTATFMMYTFDFMQGYNARMYGLIYHPGLQPANYPVALAQAIRDRHSKWPHDRVYAIDSVLRKLGAQPPAPDYQKPVGQVYRDALISLMEWNPTLIALLVDCGSRLPDAPSWVPDWSQNSKSWVPDSYIYHGVEKRPLTDQDPGHSVSGNTLSVKSARMGTPCYCLTLEKFEVDEHTSNTMTTNDKLVRNVQLLAEWTFRIRRDTLVHKLHESIPLTIMLTLAGRSIPRSGVTSEEETSFRRMFGIIQQLGFQVNSGPGDYTAITAAAMRALEAISQNEACKRLFLDTCNRIAGRRGLLVSDNGFIGSGPISTKQGDTISLIEGVPVPMALRKIGEDYQVVGPVFIDGFMGLPTDNLQRINLE
ncbi:amidase [Fusarium mexicanum]|uniref:Amidase n=1 Tax=Fusarium mexicanum TaxID=751941 RepID=A0A8H5J1K4_9HYPO|nr:amidase [Fusarium mexicanum]